MQKIKTRPRSTTMANILIPSIGLKLDNNGYCFALSSNSGFNNKIVTPYKR